MPKRSLEGDDTIENSDQKLGSSGRDCRGRFQPENRLSLGNGGGRPRSEVRSLLAERSERALAELERIAFDADHPLHATRAFDAVLALAKITTPKLQAVALAPQSSDGPITDLGALMRAALRNREAREAKERGQSQTAI